MADIPYHVTQTMRLKTTTERSDQVEYRADRSRRLVVQAILVEMTKTFGVSFVPDLFAALQARPAYLETAWELFKAELGLEVLDVGTRHIVALAITTNRNGTYLISALPQAFRLSAVGPRRCETILSMIGMFQTFNHYLSDRASRHIPATA